MQLRMTILPALPNIRRERGVMALSEHEQRVLREMERALYEEDPRFVSKIRETAGLRSPKVGLFALLATAGVIAIVAGVAIPMSAVGIAGFVALLGGVYGIISAIKGTPRAAAPRAAKRKKPGFMQRAEERFRDRRDGFGS